MSRAIVYALAFIAIAFMWVPAVEMVAFISGLLVTAGIVVNEIIKHTSK